VWGAEVSGGFYDLAKAFDCVSHRLLLQNLQYCGIQGEILGWFESYLSNRKQRAELKLLHPAGNMLNMGSLRDGS
jgi:hypothetical protein